MPYIAMDQRHQFRILLSKLPSIATKGELEYCIFYLMKKYMQTKDIKYLNLHDTTYAAIHCGDEFRRRYLDNREDIAKEKNGDIDI